jgi:hypothetical protein
MIYEKPTILFADEGEQKEVTNMIDSISKTPGYYLPKGRTYANILLYIAKNKNLQKQIKESLLK